MTVEQKELISAFIDGELNSAELDELMEMLSRNDRAKSELFRYQVLSDHMNGYLNMQKPIDISTRISAAIDKEASLTVEDIPSTRSNVIRLPDWFWKQAAGFAVAASIGALAVVGLITQPQGTAPEIRVAESTTTPKQSSNRWTVGEAEVEDRLNNYLVDHNEYAGASGLFSYARVVSYSEE